MHLPMLAAAATGSCLARRNRTGCMAATRAPQSSCSVHVLAAGNAARRCALRNAPPPRSEFSSRKPSSRSSSRSCTPGCCHAWATAVGARASQCARLRLPPIPFGTALPNATPGRDSRARAPRLSSVAQASVELSRQWHQEITPPKYP